MAAHLGFKDLFSAQAADYARFRPTYPSALFAHLAAAAPARALAVDIGTGNGQAAVALAAHFERVIGVDPSAGQLANAQAHPRVDYRTGAAEATGLDAANADLVTVAQAFHWFKHDTFFSEVRRITRPGGVLALWCYGLTSISPEIDAVVHELYEDYLGPYWEPERRLVEDAYRSVSFPFEERAAPDFRMDLTWTFRHLVGYLGTWSPLKRYVQDRGENPIEILLPKLTHAWGEAHERLVTWPLSLRLFQVR